DGLVLIGGRDIPPSLYGQTPHETVALIPKRRVAFDRALIAQWMASKKPILGVCLGMQFTNVVLGGTMIQDIPSHIGTAVTHRRAYHAITIEPTSRLADILNSETATVYSIHHQAVDTLGADLKPVAESNDGVVEALERTDGGLGLFVQWHPEAMSDRYPEHTNAIYGYLVQLCTE
ncbi:MAG: gamma-glutamyl-gamma-aminobutyrate hydrolase family protein, partial [Planctomycetes bacterium]|nr:gamma-glutamyl-gamma-aminobutyrate hydrolase family protein [Planctomycetota bacterium]